MTSNFNEINSEVIKLQMNKITQSKKFLSSDRFTRFLEYVVNQTISGNADKIKEYSIGLDVFDKDEKFIPQLDPIVRIYAGRLRQALKDYYHTEGKNDVIKIEIPKGTYVPEFTHIDKKPKVPTNINKPKNRFKNLKKPSLKILLLSLIGLIALTFLIINISKKSFQEDVFGRTSIEIKPLQNLSNIPENDQFILRLIDHTQIALGQFSSVLVSNGFNKSNSRYIMTGSINQIKDIIKINIKLIDNKFGIQVFGKEYKETLDNNAAIYIEEILANKIAVDLADEFGELQKYRLRSSQNNDSKLLPHEAVMLYYHYLANMNKKDNEKVLIELQKMVKNFDQYEPAWAAISGLCMDKYRHFDGNIQDLLLAKEAIKKAEIINPRSVHVQNHLALIALSDRNLDAFFTAIEKQMSLNSNSTMLGQVGLWLCLIGDFTKGIPLIEQAKLRNPYYPRFFHFGNYFNYIEKEDFENAYLEIEKVKMPQLFWDPLLKASTLGNLGRNQEAFLALKELLILKPNFQDNGLEIMKRSLYLKKHQDIIVQGLEKINFKMTVSK